MADNMFTNFENDIQKYLIAKLPDVPVETSMEIGGYIGYKVTILANDIIRDRDKEWVKTTKYTPGKYSRSAVMNDFLKQLKEQYDIMFNYDPDEKQLFISVALADNRLDPVNCFIEYEKLSDDRYIAEQIKKLIDILEGRNG